MKTIPPLAPLDHTQRGFEIIRFGDLYGDKCSLQQSSLATEDAIWLGITDPDPKVMVSEAHLVGLSPTPLPPNGWMPYPVPEQVFLTTRMHLGREQVKALVGHLQRWLKTGSIE